MIKSILSNLWRWTPRDRELAEFIRASNEARANMEIRVQEIAKATLDSEDSWIREMAKHDPMCFLEAATKCRDPEKA